MKKSIWLEGIISLFVLLWLYTGLSKYIAFDSFKHDMYNQPFPHWFENIVIALLPPIEIITTLLLLFNRTIRTGLWISLILMLLFTIYAIAILAGAFAKTPCGCGGVIRSLSWQQHLVFNIVFTTLAIIALRLQNKKDNYKILFANKREQPKTL
ncbi:MAG: hypothetical protein JNK08_09740 [Sediminibacterium sp.]|nr:hypothetical protein [Sediminibacterium sp.]